MVHINIKNDNMPYYSNFMDYISYSSARGTDLINLISGLGLILLIVAEIVLLYLFPQTYPIYETICKVFKVSAAVYVILLTISRFYRQVEERKEVGYYDNILLYFLGSCATLFSIFLAYKFIFCEFNISEIPLCVFLLISILNVIEFFYKGALISSADLILSFLIAIVSLVGIYREYQGLSKTGLLILFALLLQSVYYIFFSEQTESKKSSYSAFPIIFMLIALVALAAMAYMSLFTTHILSRSFW